MIYTKNDFEKFISRLHPTYKKNVSKDDFLRLIELIENYKCIVLDVGYGTYIFQVQDDRYLKWSIGTEKYLDKNEALELCSRYWNNLSNLEML